MMKNSNIEGLKLIDNSNSTFNYYSIYILENKRDHFKNYLNEKNIANAIYYPKTLPSCLHIILQKNFQYQKKFVMKLYLYPYGLA